jgi:hypothetical protein
LKPPPAEITAKKTSVLLGKQLKAVLNSTHNHYYSIKQVVSDKAKT